MTMRTPLRLLALGAALACSGLAAQEAQKTWTAGAGFTIALDGLRAITHHSNGGVLDFGYNGHLGNSTVPFRASLGYQYLPGTEDSGVKQSLTSLQLAGDILIDTPWKDLQFITGLSINKYKVKSEVVDVGNNTETVKGPKFGARLGMEYKINPAWSAQLLLQMTELGTDAAATTGINPSWLQLGVKFHF
jgi:hypothetical protein